MIVFEYFYRMMDIFGPRMDEWACGKHRHIDNEDARMVYFKSIVIDSNFSLLRVYALLSCVGGL